jgi:hypothetical protein
VPPQPIKALGSKGFRNQIGSPFYLSTRIVRVLSVCLAVLGFIGAANAQTGPTSKEGALAADHPHVASGQVCKRLAFGAKPLVSVLDARSAVGEYKSPLLQALDEFGRNAEIAELLCRLPCLPATDIPVGVERSVSVPC